MEEKQVSEKLMDFFEEHQGEVFSKEELLEILKVADRILREHLRKLIKHHEIDFERISCRVARKIYNNNNLKRGIRLYFVE